MTYRPLLDKFSTKVRLQASRIRPDGKSTPGTIPPGQSGTNFSRKPNRLPPHLSSDGFILNGDRGTLLSNIKARGDGFEHLSDADENVGATYIISTRATDDVILKTINIRQSWEQAK